MCARANIKRLPFPKKSETRADQPLYRVHLDLCGPLPISYGNFRYFMPIVDDFSRWRSTRFLKSKSDALSEFIIYRTATERFTGRKIAIVRLDNAQELISGEFEQYCAREGITYEKSIPDASQQNGTAERSIGIITAMARAMLVDANLPDFFWPLAVQTATHIVNRLPTAALPPDITPFHLWWKKPPDISHFQIFGTRVIARKTNSDSLTKTVPRGEPGIFVGYAVDARGYLIWFPDAKCVRARRDVKFLDVPDQPSTDPVGSSPLWDDIMNELERRFLDPAERNAPSRPTETIPPSLSVPVTPVSVNEQVAPVPLNEHVAPVPVPYVVPHSHTRLYQNRNLTPFYSEPDPPARNTRSRTRIMGNNVDYSSEGGQRNYAQVADDEEIAIEVIDADDLAIQINSLLTPIDDLTTPDPKTVSEAQRSEYWNFWKGAMHEELAALDAKGVYEEVATLPPNRKAIDAKWVLHIKRNGDGQISRFKARFVARGFTQIPGQDFDYTFAPVARWDSIRVVLAIAALQNLYLRHIDIKTAFLNGPLTEEIYLKKPAVAGPGYWRLKKGLYGLKQAGRSWYIEFNKKYQTLGFKRCESDWSVHVRPRDTQKSISTTSVDDILLGSTDEQESDSVATGLTQFFEITDNGKCEHFLGCRIIRNFSRRSITVNQEGYSGSILREFNMETSNAVSTPFPPGTMLTKDSCPQTDEERQAMKDIPYCKVVGKLMYLVTTTRPDLAYAVRELAKFMSNYGPEHWKVAKHVLRYLQGTRSQGLIFGNVDDPYPIFRSFTDADWASSKDRRSISGYVMMIGTTPIAWSSKQQAVVALSSCEAEYIACSHAACEILWLRNLFRELGYPQPTSSILYCDNNGTVDYTHDPHSHSRMKHIDIKAHFIRNQVNEGTMNVVRIPGTENIADVFTKPLSRVLHHNALRMLGVNAGQGGVSDGDQRH